MRLDFITWMRYLYPKDDLGCLTLVSIEAQGGFVAYEISMPETILTWNQKFGTILYTVNKANNIPLRFPRNIPSSHLHS